MAFGPKTKTPGDLIKSAEWNEAMEEIARLGSDKLDMAGGTVQGDLAATGALGVGTTEPEAKVHVKGGGVHVDDVQEGSRIPSLRLKTTRAKDGTESLFSIDVARGAGLTNLVAGAQIDPASAKHLYHSGRGASRISMGDGQMSFLVGASTGVTGEEVAWNNRIAIKPHGNIRLAEDVKVSGDLRYGGSFGPASARALKQDIAALPLAQAESVLEELQPVSFCYKREPDTPHLGFIADDVPDEVATRDRESVDMMHIIAVLTRVVKHQQEEIDALKERLETP